MNIMRTCRFRMTVIIVERIRKVSSSQSLILIIYKLLKTDTTKFKIGWDCHEVLNKLADINKVMLMWAPAHSSVRENTRADNFAKI